MEPGFATAIVMSLLAAGVTTCGIYAIRHFDAWARHNASYFACFAAGILIAVSFLHVVPTSFTMHPRAPVYLFAGYLFMHFFNRFITAYVCDKPSSNGYALGLVPLVGIGFHSFLDGIVYSISFSVSVQTGVLVTVGMVLHEFPEGLITYTLLVRGGFSKRTSFVLAFFAAALTTPLGTVLSYPFVSRVAQPQLGALLALSAGALIYVGATHLLPQAEREPRRFSLVALAAGIAVAVGIVLSASGH